MHSRATERKKGEKWVKKANFLANRKSLNHFNIKKHYLMLAEVPLQS
jgi:Fe-S cluster biosynthesis and repair protein YggX